MCSDSGRSRLCLRTVTFTLVLAALSWGLPAEAALAVCDATRSGMAATFTCDATSDQITFSASSGSLRHNLGGTNGFNSDADFDNSVGGDQTLAASVSSAVNVNLAPVGPNFVVIGTPASPAGTLLAAFSIGNSFQNDGDIVVVDDSGSTVGKTIDNSADAITSPLTGGERLHISILGRGFSGGVVLACGTGADTVNVTSVRGL